MSLIVVVGAAWCSGVQMQWEEQQQAKETALVVIMTKTRLRAISFIFPSPRRCRCHNIAIIYCYIYCRLLSWCAAEKVVMLRREMVSCWSECYRRYNSYSIHCNWCRWFKNVDCCIGITPRNNRRMQNLTGPKPKEIISDGVVKLHASVFNYNRCASTKCFLMHS